MRAIAGLVLLIALSVPALAADPKFGTPPVPALAPVPLWPAGQVPGALGTTEFDIPTLTVYEADPTKATGAAFIICPGGGYGGLAPHEGDGYAIWLAQHGIAGLVLRYRLGSHGYHHPAMINDALRAMRLTRASAADWKINPHMIGIMGSSAGGHLAATLVTHFDAGNPAATDPVEQQSSRPDLGVLCYAVITMGPDTQSGTHDNLIGKDPSPDLIELLSNEKHVTKDTPPCFIWHTYDDNVVKVVNALDFADALLANHVPFELHVYEKGGHGMGLHGNLPPGVTLRWADDLLTWLGEHDWLTREETPPGGIGGNAAPPPPPLAPTTNAPPAHP